jgi:L-ascorbate metabolism protein UlaG (beta-lactamase superfamily)
MTNASITLIGGPTVLVELQGLRFLTDPTFDNPGDYHLPYVRLRKTSKPAINPAGIGVIDAVLLSHDQRIPTISIFPAGPFCPRRARC